LGIGLAAAVACIAPATAGAQVVVPPMMAPPPPSFIVVRNRWGPPFVYLPPPPPPVVVVPRMVPPQSQALQAPPARTVAEPRPRPAPRDKARAAQLTTLGDRLLKVGNLKRAEERYSQALRADARATAPMVGLAQIALIRGDYDEAADHFRVAQAADPQWLRNNPRDVESMYMEPAAFHKHIAALESHLQAEPEDRDAWFVLGVEWLLSGRAERASDVFLRLSDREHKDDRVVAAFLAAADTKAAEARLRGD
jgi:tetratricopeptide (TPR) repeat protein